jgi:hypothetical protein
MVYADPLVTQISYFHFEITDKVKADLSDEIAACKNGVALYNHKDLNDESFLQGQMEIDKAYDVSGEHINIELVKTISWQRLGVRPFPRENRIRIIDGSRYLDL